MEELKEFLQRYLIPYRHAVISQYKTSPLLLGGAGRQFEIFTPLFQVMPVGPRFLPVPGGAFSTEDNLVKFPAETYNKDCLNVWENNLDALALGYDVTGARVDNGHPWIADSVTLGAGGGNILVGGIATHEIVISQLIIEPDTLLLIQNLTLTFSASAGNLLGHIQNLQVPFVFDIVTPSYINLDNLILTFPRGLRLQCDTNGADIIVGVAGGSGNENTLWSFEYRDLS